MLDHFQMGPNLVRGFAPAGIGPRDLTPGTTNDALGGTHVLGRQRRIPDAAVLPAEGDRHQGRDLRRRRFAVGLSRARPAGTRPARRCRSASAMPSMIRSSVGVGLIWDSPLGPLRFDLAYPLKKYCATPTRRRRVCDRPRSSASAAARSSDVGRLRVPADHAAGRYEHVVIESGSPLSGERPALEISNSPLCGAALSG